MSRSVLIIYRLLFACDKAFARNRAYLLLTVAAFVVPALSVPVWTPGNRRRTVRFPHSGRDLHRNTTRNAPRHPTGRYSARTPTVLLRRQSDHAAGVIGRRIPAVENHPSRHAATTGQNPYLRPQHAGFRPAFFNRIYINELGTKPQDIAQIVAHETHHARLRHSWDILLSSVLRILFWWNPFVWLWERSLREVHEFQADDAVLNNGFDSEQYIALILGGLTVIRPEFVSGFCYSLIKKRLIMIARNKQKRRSKFRILLALPLTALLTVCFSLLNARYGNPYLRRPPTPNNRTLRTTGKAPRGYPPCNKCPLPPQPGRMAEMRTTYLLPGAPPRQPE